MKKFSKYLLSLAIISLLAVPMLATAQGNFGINEVNTGLGNTLSNRDPRSIVGSIINIALGFLGVIAVVIVIMGGFKWMTAGGNEEKVTEAKKLLGAGVIGIVIILAAWALANFILNSVYNATKA